MTQDATCPLEAPGDRFERSLRGPRLLAACIICVFFVAGGVWAGLAELSSAALAPGVIGPESGARIFVQHLEGGIVAQRHVQDGDHVARGDPLVTLNDIGARAGRNEAFFERAALLAEQAMLVAESEAEAFHPPTELIQLTDEPEVASILRATRALFDDRAERRAARESIRANRITQLEEQIRGDIEVEAALSEQLALLNEEITGLQSLVERGHSPRTRLLALQRERERINGDIAARQASRAQRAESIEQVRLEAQEEADALAQERSSRLFEVRARLNALEGALGSREDALERTVVTAPIDGVVVEMAAPSVGSVIAPGARILDIVPVGERMVVNARVNPADIDIVAVGQEARVHLTVFRQRNLSPLRGEVISVSADRLIDDRSGIPYFSAEIALDNESLAAARAQSDQNLQLQTGMPVEVMIVTGRRSVLEYLFEPLMSTLRRGLRES